MKQRALRLSLLLACVTCWMLTVTQNAKAEWENETYPFRIAAYEGFESGDLGLAVDWQPFDDFSAGYIYGMPLQSTNYQDQGLQVVEARYWPIPKRLPIYVGLGVMKSGGYFESLTLSSEHINQAGVAVTPGNYTAAIKVEPRVAPSLGAGFLIVTSLADLHLAFWWVFAQSLAPDQGTMSFSSDNPAATASDLEAFKAQNSRSLQNSANNSQSVITQLGFGIAF